jgi:retron-type reverse transcriptase
MSYKLLFQKTYDLVKWVYPAMNKFPRKQRLVLSQRIEVTTIRILELTIDLSERDTAANRKKIIHEVHKLQILFRLCKDLSYLDFKRYEYVSSLLTEISQILDSGGGGLEMACRNLYSELCSFKNLELAYKKARKGKRKTKAVQEFEFNLENNLLRLKHELETFTYKPLPIKQFVVRDPKTRLISASHFRDRVVHHALCNIIEPVFDRTFIHDSCANRLGKGNSKALERFDRFKIKVSGNGRLVNEPKDDSMVIGYVMKADIRHYFDAVDHEILMEIIQRRINDAKVLNLTRKILDNHMTECPGKGMPIGNMTSQFFANLYLNELDYFVKHKLRAKCYIRYVDDFVIFHNSKQQLEEWKEQIGVFLENELKLELHPEKSQVHALHKGTNFLGFRIFYHHRLLKKSNIRKMKARIKLFSTGNMRYDKLTESFLGWSAYAEQADSYKIRERMGREIGQITQY